MKKKETGYIFYKFSVLTFLMMLSAINYNIFINPANIVAGGVNGISIILNEVFKIDASLIILFILLAILLVGIILNEKKLVLSATYSSIIYPVFVYLTSSLTRTIIITSGDFLLLALVSGMIAGLVSGIVCKLEASQGGVILIAQIIGKKLKLSVPRINTFFSAIIIISGAFVFGINSVLYALVYLFANKVAMEKVIIGVSQKKLFQIITSNPKEVEKYITKELKMKYTEFNVISGKNNEKKDLIMVSIPTIEYFRLKEGISRIDKNAFVLITDAFESAGGK